MREFIPTLLIRKNGKKFYASFCYGEARRTATSTQSARQEIIWGYKIGSVLKRIKKISVKIGVPIKRYLLNDVERPLP